MPAAADTGRARCALRIPRLCTDGPAVAGRRSSSGSSPAVDERLRRRLALSAATLRGHVRVSERHPPAPASQHSNAGGGGALHLPCQPALSSTSSVQRAAASRAAATRRARTRRLWTARKGSVLVTKAVETQGKGSVLPQCPPCEPATRSCLEPPGGCLLRRRPNRTRSGCPVQRRRLPSPLAVMSRLPHCLLRSALRCPPLRPGEHRIQKTLWQTHTLVGCG